MGRSADSDKLRTFSCFTTDDRYSVPTLQFVVASDEARARVLATQLLMEDPCHASIEVREGGNILFFQARPKTQTP